MLLGRTRRCSLTASDRVHAFCVGSARRAPRLGRSRSVTRSWPGSPPATPTATASPRCWCRRSTAALAFLNASGHPSPGWPRAGSPERFATNTPPLAVDLTGDGRPEVVALNASGVIAALDGQGKHARRLAARDRRWAAAAPRSRPISTATGRSRSWRPTGSTSSTPTRVPGTLHADRARRGRCSAATPAARARCAPAATQQPGRRTAGPLVSGSLKAYPNPARRKPVQFAYQLTEDASVEFDILDTSGHEVAHWTRSGRRSDNYETWDPTGVPAGLYVARVRFSGPGGSRTESVPLGIVR